MQKIKLNTSAVKKGIVTEGSDLTLKLVQLMMKSQHHHTGTKRTQCNKENCTYPTNTQEGTLPKYIGYTFPLEKHKLTQNKKTCKITVVLG